MKIPGNILQFVVVSVNMKWEKNLDLLENVVVARINVEENVVVTMIIVVL